MSTDTAFVPGETRPPEPDPSSTGTDRASRRAPLLLAAVALVLVLAVASWFVFFSGGGSATPDVAASAAPKSASVPSAPAPEPSTAAVSRVNNQAGHVFRDPFKPLISTGKGDTVTVTGPTSTPAGTPGPTSTETSGPPAPTADPTAADDSTKLRLISVAADNNSARVSVDGDAADVTVGLVFADKFKALRFSEGTCGTFQFGDERFDLCEGQTARLG